VCSIHRNAILRFEGVPTNRRELKEFDVQLRQCFTSQAIAEAIEAKGTGARVCELLAKEDWTDAERSELYESLEDSYED